MEKLDGPNVVVIIDNGKNYDVIRRRSTVIIKASRTEGVNFLKQGEKLGKRVREILYSIQNYPA